MDLIKILMIYFFNLAKSEGNYLFYKMNFSFKFQGNLLIMVQISHFNFKNSHRAIHQPIIFVLNHLISFTDVVTTVY